MYTNIMHKKIQVMGGEAIALLAPLATPLVVNTPKIKNICIYIFNMRDKLYFCTIVFSDLRFIAIM